MSRRQRMQNLRREVIPTLRRQLRMAEAEEKYLRLQEQLRMPEEPIDPDESGEEESGELTR